MTGKALSILILVISCLAIAEGHYKQFPHTQMFPSYGRCNQNEDFILEPPLRIGVWNTQRFGRRKVANATIADYFSQIINRYDIIVLQEVVDSSQEAVYDLLKIVNNRSASINDDNPFESPKGLYNVTVSERVGKTSYKEQYAFFYRQDLVSVKQTIQYVDEFDDFAYDPFIVVFNTPTLYMEHITLVSLHASPKFAPEEIDALIKVHDYLNSELLLNDIFFLGDFNAGCTYVTSKDWENLQFYLDDRFTWLISDHIDTTTKFTTCPYDRIVMAGEKLSQNVYEKSAKAFHYDDELNITDLELIEDISDHFPVEVSLKSKIQSNHWLRIKFTAGPIYPYHQIINEYISECLEVHRIENMIIDQIYDCSQDYTKLDISNVLKENYFTYGNEYVNRTVEHIIQDNVKCLGKHFAMNIIKFQTHLSSCGNRPKYVNMQGNMKEVGFDLKNMKSLQDFLVEMHSSHSCIYTREINIILNHKLKNGVLNDPSVYMEGIPAEKQLQLYCQNDQCYINVSTAVPFS